MKLVATGITDVGRRRDRNEDAFLINDEMQLFVVADGMGGHVGGSYASTMAVTTIEDEVGKLLLADPGDADPVDFLREGLAGAVNAAGARIFGVASDNPSWKGMGTTVVVVLVVGTNAFVAHVGDSRVYTMRDGDIEQITDDHSLVAESVREGLLTEEQARRHKMRNVITRALGFHAEVEVDVQVRAVTRGDRFLLCSDGLSGKLEPREMLDLLDAHAPLEAARQLVIQACARGGEDNITAVTVHVENAA